MSGKRKFDYYVVSKGEGLTNGHEFGIFTEWTECSPHVIGVKGSMFQGCKTIDTAKLILQSSSLTPVTIYDNGEWMSLENYLKDNPCKQNDQHVTEHDNNHVDEIEEQIFQDCEGTGMSQNNSDQTEPKHVELPQMAQNDETNEQPDPETSSQCPECESPNNKSMIECISCKKWIHYGCTKLPRYELARYIRYKQRKYNCIACTMHDEKITITVEKLPVFDTTNNTTCTNSPDMSLVEVIKSQIKAELYQFKSSLDKVENSVVILAEKNNSDKTSITERLDAINKLVAQIKITNAVGTDNKKLETIIDKLSNLTKNDGKSGSEPGLEQARLENQQLKNKIDKTNHESMLEIEHLKEKLESTVKNHKLITDEKDKHITSLQKDIDHKDQVMREIINENTRLKKDNEELSQNLSLSKEEILIMKNQLRMTEDQNNEHGSWSQVERKEKKEKPKVLLVGTSNTEQIKTERLSAQFDTMKKIAYHIDQAEKVIDELEESYNPDVIAYHILSNELTKKSSSECVLQLEKLIQKTKEKRPDSKIVVSLATNRSDERKYNLKVNTVNSLVKEMHEESSDFVICDNHNLSVSGEINKKFINNDGYHLSDVGVKVLAANIRKCVDQILGIPFIKRRGPVNRKPWQKPKRGS